MRQLSTRNQNDTDINNFVVADCITPLVKVQSTKSPNDFSMKMNGEYIYGTQMLPDVNKHESTSQTDTGFK